jgi:hypothetical protein
MEYSAPQLVQNVGPRFASGTEILVLHGHLQHNLQSIYSAKIIIKGLSALTTV